ncbi:ABC transporter substrate-binding protein [Nonomuraea sp. NPDC049784]|uniref:ABC transporter substrate-binding protein n=1 Tax=Nonomuraea sp. NPDC049784 TaxID=3154361 RepID=UPI0033E2BCC4
MTSQSLLSSALCHRARAGMAGAAAAVVALTVTACGGSVTGNNGADSGGRTTIVVWAGSTGATEPLKRQLIDAFNSSQDQYTIELEVQPASADAHARLINAIKNKQGPNLVLDDGQPQSLGQVIAMGSVVPLDEYLGAADSTLKKSDFTKGMLDTGTFNGKVYSLPTQGGDYALIYNKAMFKAAGIEKPPATWAELQADAAKLTIGTKQYGMYLPIGTGETAPFYWQSMLWSAGGEFMNADNTKVKFNSPAGVKALTAWTDMVKNGTAYPTSLKTPSDNGNTVAMTSKKAAMAINGAYNLGVLDQALGKENIGVAPLPPLDKPAMNLGSNNSYILQGTSAQQDGAWAFLQYWLTPEVQAKWDIANGFLPTNSKTASDPSWQKHLAENPRIKVFADQLSYANSRPSIEAYAGISAALSAEFEKALLQKVSPAEALKNAEAGATTALK